MENYKKIFVGNIPFKCCVKDFINLFNNECGFIDAGLQIDPITKCTKGYGFVEFDSKENAHKIIDKQFIIGDRVLRLSEYKTKIYENKKIFVKDLYGVTLKDFEDFFKKYGNIVKSYIITNRVTGESKGMGIVEFETEISYKNALNESDSYINGQKISIYPFKDKYNETKNNNKLESTNSYINGYNAGYASGYNTGFKDGYKKGFDDSKIGRISDPTTNYLNKIINNITPI